MTISDEAVEAAAMVILEEVEPARDWSTTVEDLRELYRGVARSALRAAYSEAK